jgi:hypothetical protein
MTKKTDRQTWHSDLSSQATTEEAGDLAKADSVLLLWYFRNVVGIGEIDAYDYVCDGDYDHGIDGLFLEPSPGDEQPETLVIHQSKYVKDPFGQVGATDVDRLVGTTAHFGSADALTRLLDSKLEPRLRGLIDDFDLAAKIADDPDSVRLRLVIITSGLLHKSAKRQIANLRDRHGSDYVEVWTIDELGPLARTVRSPEKMAASIEIKSRATDVLITGETPNRVAMVPVEAIEIAKWPGITDRTLFALNVRHELAPNRVSKGLDRAIEASSEQRDFLAYHNGLTVVCDRFQQRRGKLVLERPSVANGAQSVLAFARGDTRGQLSKDLRVFVKVVEVQGRPTLEREVSRRSNTQTRVSPRNLMANSGPQLRLTREFETKYPDVLYVTRPDTTFPGGLRPIRNDDAAQWLCSFFNGWPWLAVKRESLFESDNHPHIFNQAIGPDHILLAERVVSVIDSRKDQFPETYRASWRLIRIVATYLVGRIATEAGGETSILEDPTKALADADLDAVLSRWVKIAAVAMTRRHEDLGDDADYRKDLKNQQKLKELGNAAVEAFRLAQALTERSDSDN